MLRDKRAASEVLGAILIATIVMAMSATYIMLEAGRSTKETMGIVDLIRVAERRQKHLLSHEHCTALFCIHEEYGYRGSM